ncbi:hypothetical protein SNE40_002393 [Patella caerulea]|uniref:ADP-ribosylation factor-like protein 16 n=1 Tax=Patella caerulea TaxID=87958 RepID=A0AAN8K2L5_PATCE
MVLLIGPTGSGKTLILKRLQAHNFSGKGGIENLDDVPSTIPTVGTNIVNIITGRRNSELTVRELGGSMAPIWNKYYKDTSAIIFVIDVSNRFQIASACIQLLTMMSSSEVNVPVAIVFNKIDMMTVMSSSEIETVLRLDEVVESATQKVSIFSVSAKTGKNLNNLLKWIVENYQIERPNVESMET